jgi:phenylacetate-coenzyme A ligase PaaK-like adenylate-forming protein
MVSAMSSSTTARAYWKPEEETLARPALEALQLERLKRTVARVCESVPLYRKKFEQANVTPGDIRALADLRRLPFTTGADLRESYPAGMLAVGGGGGRRRAPAPPPPPPPPTPKH